MRLSQIRDFLAVVEAGSIRAGARKLEVAQPTITKSVRGLEAELHAQLLQRTANGVPTKRLRFGYRLANAITPCSLWSLELGHVCASSCQRPFGAAWRSPPHRRLARGPRY